jgi:EPS-associated MarR family transcriptional regulator
MDHHGEEVLNILRELSKAPESTQRQLSATLGISLGKVNFLIKSLIRKGYVKAGNFRNSDNRVAYAYILTPHGLEEKAKMTFHFLVRKSQQYDALKKEIEILRQEVSGRERRDRDRQSEPAE